MGEKIDIGTVGLGLMGCSIATCILAHGHRVTSLIKSMDTSEESVKRILNNLEQLKREGLLNGNPEQVLQKLTITDKVTNLSHCEVVIESIFEDVDEKKLLYSQLETVLSHNAIIGSNTSAIPISILQDGMIYPERLIGIHWAEPAHVTKFLEVICGQSSKIEYAEKIIALTTEWGKEPSLVKRDIRGFITNRLMYAMLREALHLVDKGYANYEDVDRACRNDIGFWITFAGLFRFMDLTGIPAYLSVMKDLFRDLDNSDDPPEFMKKLVASGAKGVSNAQGFYPYTKETADKWEAKFLEFTYDIRKLSEKYPQNIGEQ